MKNIITAVFAGICLLVSCETIDTVKTVDKDFVTNYETFWNMVNENYCFLGTAYGNDKNVDWQAVYDKWMPVVKNEVKEVNAPVNENAAARLSLVGEGTAETGDGTE